MSIKETDGIQPEPTGKALAEIAIESPSQHDDIEKKLEELSPEEAEMFVQILELTMRKRRWMLIGNFLALAAVIFGMIFALYMYGTREAGTFVGWVFILPPGLAAGILYLVGGHVRRMKPRKSQSL